MSAAQPRASLLGWKPSQDRRSTCGHTLRTKGSELPVAEASLGSYQTWAAAPRSVPCPRAKRSLRSAWAQKALGALQDLQLCQIMPSRREKSMPSCSASQTIWRFEPLALFLCKQTSQLSHEWPPPDLALS